MSMMISQGALIGHRRVLAPSCAGRTDLKGPVLEIKGRLEKFSGPSNADHLQRVLLVSVLRAQTTCKLWAIACVVPKRGWPDGS